ncbi:DUF2214 domain-containing protein [Aliirhizobium terrae]|uniref:DUF6644 family protein n=1 Tax=Terrirhizobium terrae TaxID=2926709 RepID=UPI0025767C26|nr:DUF6644 family protein [Rhizobium sp. CC-CFT758]WJH39248.1 DUF2214 domain-containing protein [Rhizobium sp. CC-CFT758]
MEWIAEWIEPLSATPVARLLIRSSTAYLLVNAAHILSLGTLFGAILALDLRLLGLAKPIPLPVVAPYLSRLAGTGLVLTMISGLCLFSVRPVEYATNPAFLWKLGLIALGLLNVIAVHRSSGWKAVLQGGGVTTGLRISAFASIAIWIGAVVAGRWIGFL